MGQFKRIARAVLGEPWAILESKYNEIVELVDMRANGTILTDEQIRARIGGEPPPRAVPRTDGAVAVIPVYGVVAQRMGLMTQYSGGTSTEAIAAAVKQAVGDPNIAAIVLDVDSPGGAVAGVTELAAVLLKARQAGKPIVAVANSLAASAAYWFPSAAHEFVATPSAQVGAIGVITAHEDISKALEQQGLTVTLITAGKYKADDNPYGPLTVEARAAIQKRIDQVYAQFVRDVAAGRGVDEKTVREGFGLGRVVSAKDALAEGMIDRIDTLEGTIARLLTVEGRAEALGMAARHRAAPISAATDPEPVPQAAASFGCTCGINCQCQDGRTEWCDASCERCEAGCACRSRVSSLATADDLAIAEHEQLAGRLRLAELA
jgi:signal peptide peptidase SppA